MSRADLAVLARLKWTVVRTCAIAGALGALLLAALSPYAALSAAVGVACGIGNMLALMRGGERLLETQNPIFFGLSSLLRLAAFSIVAAALAVRGPWWSLGPFLAGFFLPLVTYALCAWRAFHTDA